MSVIALQDYTFVSKYTRCNMFFKPVKERRIFVTTHNRKLLDLLQGCESLLSVKLNDETTLDN